MNRVSYVVPCPICGRRLEVRINLMGKRVACPHCRGQFEASGPASANPSAGLVDDFGLLHRADEILAQLAQRQNLSGP